MTKLRNMFGLFVLVCALCFIPNVYAAEGTQQVSTWNDLSACLTGSTYTVCQLSSDIEVDPDGKNIYMHDIEEEKTLDLQGFTLNASHILFIQNAKLTITGTSAGKIVGPSKADTGIAVDLYGNAEVLIDNVTVDGGEGTAVNLINASNNFTLGENATVNGLYGVTIVQGSTGSEATIRGTINATMGMTVHGGNTVVENAPVVNIESTAKITGSDVSIGIYAAGYGIWNINGATIRGGSAISIRSGEFEIKDATIEATGTYDDSTIPSGGTQPTGSAIDIVASDSASYSGQIKIHISGETTVSSENGYAIHEFGLGEGKTSEDSESKVLSSIEIEAGNYEGAKGSISVEDNDSFGEVTEHFISGGTFTKGGEKDSVTATFLDESRKEDDEGNVVPAKVTVNFHNGENNTDSKEVNNSDIPSQLESEEVDSEKNYQFDGWYLDENFEEKLTSDTVISEESIDLYARYVVTVTLDGVEEPTTITKGTKFTKPTDPTKEGYVFQGWYTSSDYEKEFDFDSEINENTILYAKFAKELGITVKGEEGTFDSLEGETYADLKEQLADIIEKLETEAEEANKHFGGFYYEDEEGNPVYVEDETILTEDIELVPYYVVEITIGEEIFTQEEELTLGEIVWSQFDNVEGKVLSHFVDEKGNKYTGETMITEDVTLRPVYVDETEVPNTLDNVTSTAMMTMVGFVTMLVAGVLAIKSRKA